MTPSPGDAPAVFTAREIAELPSPVRQVANYFESAMQCQWCKACWDARPFREDDGSERLPHPDNGCLWPRAHAALLAPPVHGGGAPPHPGTCATCRFYKGELYNRSGSYCGHPQMHFAMPSQPFGCTLHEPVTSPPARAGEGAGER